MYKYINKYSLNIKDIASDIVKYALPVGTIVIIGIVVYKIFKK